MGVDRRSDEMVYRHHAGELMTFATCLVGPDDAGDVVVEAFIRVRGSRVWADAVDRRAVWFQAVAFEAKSFQRSAARRRAREQRAATPVGDVQSDLGLDGDDEVRVALDSLSSQQRTVIVLTYWLDLDPHGVGELLGVSEGTIRKQLARARQKLRKELERG